MKKYLLATTCLIFLLFWPIQAQEIATSSSVLAARRPPVIRRAMNSETTYLNQLALRGFKLDTQGLLIESLDSSTIYADLNSNVGFNPASVIKVATSMAALYRFGPDYRFQTGFYTDGVVNRKTKTLNGDLVLFSSGDPTLMTADVSRLIREVIRSGISRVSGSLVVTGPFTYGGFYTTDRAVNALGKLFRKLGVRITGPVKHGVPAGTEVATRVSVSLREILFRQNAFSSNPTADRLGEAIGGPAAGGQVLL